MLTTDGCAAGTIGLGRMCRPTRKTSARGQAMGPNLAGGLHLQEEVLVGLDVLDLPPAAPYVQTPSWLQTCDTT